VKSNYYASLSYLSDDAYIHNSDFERITGRVNVNTKFKEWFKTGFNLSGTSTKSNQAVDGVNSSSSFVNPFRSTRVIAPIYPVFLHDPAANGAYVLDPLGNRIYDSGNTIETRAAGGAPGRNVIQETLLNKNINKGFAVSARTYLEFSFLKYFKFTSNASLDKTFSNTEVYTNTIIGDAAPDGSADRSSSVISGVNYNQLLDFNKKINSHSFSALFGHESFDYETNFLSGSKKLQIVSNNTELINFVTTTDLFSRTRNYSTESYFSRLGYDYNDKYFLSASFRTDASSKFAKESRWGDFWSIGASWRLDREDFIKNITWINSLKLRSSHGKVGNDSNTSNSDLSFYVSQGLYSLGVNNGTEAGILSATIAAPNLQWEVNTQSDVALEFGLFKNRINGSVEYYNRNTEKLIFAVPNPLTSGLDSRFENIGSMFNRGLEFSLGGDIIKNQNFSWNLNVNASTIKNEFTKLPQSEIITSSKKLVVGGSIYDYWLRDWYGVDPSDGAGVYVATDEAVKKAVTTPDADIRVLNGVNVTTNINKAKLDFVGTALPDLFGSFTNTFKYNGIQLSALFTYQLGGQTYDTNYSALMSSGDYGTALSTDILRRWQKPGDVTDVPRLDFAQRANYGASSDRWLVDSDYLALRQVNLSFDLPKDLTSKLGIDTGKFFVNGENLVVFSKRKGLDVGQTFNGTTQNRFTPSRVITLGFNLNF
jgi:TonB-linked SusC/RagA family outer membrane protein